MKTSRWVPLSEWSNDYGHMRYVEWIKQWLRAHEKRLVNQAMTTSTWETFNESSSEHGHMRAFQWIKQWLRTHESRLIIKRWLLAHESRSMNQAVITGTKVPFNESSNDYVHMRAVHESSNDYGHIRDLHWIKRLLRAHGRRSMNRAMNTGRSEPLNE
jgi:hypothetical protein